MTSSSNTKLHPAPSRPKFLPSEYHLEPPFDQTDHLCLPSPALACDSLDLCLDPGDCMSHSARSEPPTTERLRPTPHGAIDNSPVQKRSSAHKFAIAESSPEPAHVNLLVIPGSGHLLDRTLHFINNSCKQDAHSLESVLALKNRGSSPSLESSFRLVARLAASDARFRTNTGRGGTAMTRGGHSRLNSQHKRTRTPVEAVIRDLGFHKRPDCQWCGSSRVRTC